MLLYKGIFIAKKYASGILSKKHLSVTEKSLKYYKSFT